VPGLCFYNTVDSECGEADPAQTSSGAGGDRAEVRDGTADEQEADPAASAAVAVARHTARGREFAAGKPPGQVQNGLPGPGLRSHGGHDTAAQPAIAAASTARAANTRVSPPAATGAPPSNGPAV